MKEAVKFCARCGCKTWFVNDVCEWSDGHAQQRSDAQVQDRQITLGSKSGPKVKNRKQAIAIMLSEKKKEKQGKKP